MTTNETTTITKSKKKMGRPTRFKPEYTTIALKYLEEVKLKKSMPFLEELALRIDCTADQISDWQLRDKDFNQACKKIKDVQKILLQKGGLAGTFKQKMAVFLLKANHGMVETERIEHVGEQQPIVFNITRGQLNNDIPQLIEEADIEPQKQLEK